MSFVEFLEAISRIADLACPFFFDELAMPFADRLNRNLQLKINILI